MKTGDLVVILAAGFAVLEYSKPGHGLFGGILRGSVIGTPSPGGGSINPSGPPAGGGGLSFDQACAQAQQQLGAHSGYWLTASCAEIKSHVCSDPTLFVGGNPIRSGLGC